MRTPIRHYLLILLAFFFLSCGAADRIQSSDGENPPGPSPTPSSGSGDLEIKSLSFNFESPIIISVGAVYRLRLSVTLSDETIYHNVTAVFDGPGDSLDETVLWFANNDNIASVDFDGELTAHKTGATTIKATIGKKSVLLEVIVAETLVELRKIDFHQDSLLFSDWDSVELTLDAEFSDGVIETDVSVDTLKEKLDCDLNFKSFNNNVVVMSQLALVTPIGKGSTLLRVECGSLAGFLTVVVGQLSPKEEEETQEELIRSIDITLDDTNWVIGEKRTLLCEIDFNTGTVSSISDIFLTPNGNLGLVSWKSSDESVVSIDGGQAILNAYGEAILTATYEDFADSEIVKVKMVPEPPNWVADSFLSTNDEYIIEYGTNGGFSSHLFPAIVYGLPQDGGTHVVSFGGGGYLLIILNDYIIVDGPGVDFTIFENAIESELFGNFAERAQVLVSEDDVNYFPFPCNAFDPNEVYEGCAGVNPVFPLANPLDPLVSGGDSFDIAAVGLAQAKYIVITDMNTCDPSDPTYYTSGGDILCGFSGQQGFDLDAMAIINGQNE